MPVLVRIFGIIIIGVVIIFLVKPEIVKKFLEYVKGEEKMIYIGGVVRIVIGAFLLLAASQCRIPLIVLILGIIAFATGIIILLIGISRVKKMLEWLSTKSINVLRTLMVIPLIFGVLMVYAA